MRLIDADALYEQLKQDEEVARNRVLDTKSLLTNQNNLNSSLIRSVAQMIERTRLKHMVADAPTIEERKKGKWVEKHHAYCDEKSGIEEWQSCQCSECGRYDTRPYLYYFEEPHFCSWCGADMRGEEE